MQWIIFAIFCCIFIQVQPQDVQKYTIGIVGQKWHQILSKILVDRKLNNLIDLKLLTENSSLPFYQLMMMKYQQLKELNINVVLGDSSLAVAQTAAHLNIPYISTDPNLVQSSEQLYSSIPHFYSLMMSEVTYAVAVIDLLNKFEIKTVSVIIDSTVDYDTFMKPFFDQKSIRIQIWTLSDEVCRDIRKLRNQLDQILEESRAANIWDFVIRADIAVVRSMILEAKYYGMLVTPNKWYLPSFLCQDIGIGAIRQIHFNITLINEQCSESMLHQNNDYRDTAILNKAIQIFRKINWKLTPDTFNKVLKTGETRLFDESGLQIKSRFSLHSVNTDEITSGNLCLVGVWIYNGSSSSLDYFYRTNKSKLQEHSQSFHVRVVAIEEHPHLIRLDNDTFEGYGVDILSELSKSMNFTYSIIMTDSIGSKDNSNWTGIVGSIQADKADMSLGPLVQTREIEEVLDFSVSFKVREISLVIRKPTPSITLFQFFSPFSNNVWIICLSALVVFTLTMWVLEYLHDSYLPNDSPFPLNLKESSWIAIACVLKQQMDIFSISIPGRIIHFTIIFFSLIIITSYTANLAAFLTIKFSPNPVNEIEDLANLPPNSKITFGTVKESPILEFFEQSKMETYQQIYAAWKMNPHWLVNDSKNGYKKAMEEPYVFIWDDSVNQYEISTESSYNCSLITIGRPFGKRSFAIGLKSESPLIKKLNLNVLHLIESGKNGNLEKKWWESKSLCVSKDSTTGEQTALALEEVAGVFLIVVIGTVLSTGWLAGQIIVYKLRQRKAQQIKKTFIENEANNRHSVTESLKKDRNGISQE